MNCNTSGSFLLVFAFGLLATSCQLAGPDLEETELSFTSLPHVTLPINSPAFVRSFATSDGWSEFWKGNGADAPDVDFQTSFATIISWGQGYSGCTHMADAVLSVRRASTAVEVFVKSDLDTGLCRAIIVPSEVISIAKPLQPVIIRGKFPAY